MSDLNTVKLNIHKMMEMGAPPQEIDTYAKSTGYSEEEIKNWELKPEPRFEWRQDYPVRRAVSRTAREFLEVGGAGAGGLVGSGAAPLAGTIVGGGLGYAIGRNIADRLDEFLGLTRKKGIKEVSIKAFEDYSAGALMEGGGMGATKGGQLAYKHTLGRLVNKLKGMFPALTDKGILLKARDILAGTLDSQVDVQARNREADDVLRRLGVETQPTLSQKGGGHEMARLEQSFTAKDPELAAKLVQRDAQINKEALDTIEQQYAGMEGAEDLLNAVRRHKRMLEGEYDAAKATSDEALEVLKLGERPQALGMEIKDALIETKSQVKAKVKKLYDDLPQDIKLSADSLKKGVADIIVDYKKKGGGPKTFPTSIVKQIRGNLKYRDKKGKVIELDEVTFGHLRDYRSQISEELRDIYRSIDPNLKLARRLQMLQTKVDASMDQMLKLSPDDAAIIKLYRRATSEYKDYVTAYRMGTVGEVLQSGRLSTGGKVTFSDIPGRFFRTGKMDEADDLIRAVGPEKAKELINDYASFDLLTVAYRDGDLATKTAKNWLSKNSDVLRKYGLYNQYDGIVNKKIISEKALAELEAYEKSVASRILDADLGDIISNIFKGKNRINSKNTAKMLLNLPGVKNNPAAHRGIQKEFKNYLLKQMELSGVDVLGNPLMSIDKGKKLLRSLEPAMREIYRSSPEKAQALFDYHKLLRFIARNKNVSYAKGSPTMEKLAGDTLKGSMAGPIAQFIAVAKGSGWFFSSAKRLFGAIISKPGKYSRAQINALLKEAVYNPEVAKTIMDFTKYDATRVPDKLRKRLGHHLVTMGIVATKRRFED